ncbi:Flavodoxin [Saliniradius amylolyticus]|uniref:Flavodoxin n=2 Tax=Saliniradius amylolyticus TaxID=2183582 RepID=A0A2S2E1V3_9ALTE|nr:Flavodoxin [Saliniradius amylolyticus]
MHKAGSTAATAYNTRKPISLTIMTDTAQIGLFYGSSTCYTEMAAEKIQAQLGEELVDIHNIKDVPLKDAEGYDILIFGISTWDFGELQEDWESSWEDIRDLNLEGKVVALYGLGDQIGYTDWFQDALGMLHDELSILGVHFIGYWPNQGYEFAQSKALTEDGDYFVGLSLDDENQFEQTDDRIQQWVNQLVDEMQSI